MWHGDPAGGLDVMRAVTVHRLVACTLALLTTGSLLRADGGAPAPALEGLVGKIRDARQKVYRAEASAEAKLQVFDGKKPDRVLSSRVHRVKVNGEQYTLETSSGMPGKPAGSVLYGKNMRYEFAIARSTDRDPWVLKSFSGDGGGTPPPQSTAESNRTQVREAVDPWLIPTIDGNLKFPADEVASIPGFKLGSVEPDGPTPRLSFTYVLDPKHPVEVRCEVVFDAGMLYIPVSVEASYRDVTNDLTESSVLTKEVEVVGTDTLKVTSKGILRIKAKQFEAHTVAGYSTTVRYGRVPETEFRLTAFGLPEPAGVVWDKPTPLYVWVLAAAGIMAMLALLLSVLRRRAITRTKPPAVQGAL